MWQEGVLSDFQCLLCGEQFDGEMVDIHLHKPETCPFCEAPQSDIVDTEEAHRNWIINKTEDMKHE